MTNYSDKAKARHVPGKMNKLEEAYSGHLELQKLAGEIYAWKFEPVALILADRTRYTPDFLVIEKDMTVRFDEVKGFWRDDARVKIKVAAEMFPWFKFKAVTKAKKRDGGEWEYEFFNKSELV